MAGGVLEFDVGNTALKWRLRHQHGFERGRLPCDEGRVAALLEGLRPDVIHISSVASDDANAMLRRCADKAAVACRFAQVSASCGGVTNAYDDPLTLGVDRWLAMVAAKRRVSGDLVIADIGTALTIDVLAADGVHQGGYILPGRRLMRESLLGGTGRIQFDEIREPSIDLGNNTASCVENASWLAAVSVISGVARRIQQADRQVSVVVTGGDAKAALQVAGVDGGSWVYVEDLVLDGLSLVLGREGLNS